MKAPLCYPFLLSPASRPRLPAARGVRPACGIVYCMTQKVSETRVSWLELRYSTAGGPIRTLQCNGDTVLESSKTWRTTYSTWLRIGRSTFCSVNAEATASESRVDLRRPKLANTFVSGNLDVERLSGGQGHLSRLLPRRAGRGGKKGNPGFLAERED